MSDTGQVVLITAGAEGIGRTIAEVFLSRGDAVHVCDVNENNIAQFLRDFPGASATQADVSQVDDVRRVFEDINDNYRQLDVLVNNAGIAGPTAAVEDVNPEDWNRTLAVNLGGPFLFAKYAVPLLKVNGGCIVNVASNAALTGCPYRAPYAASKWAVVGLTKTLAMELGRFNVRVNAVCPCSVEGERIESVLEKDASRLGLSIDEVRDVYQRQSSLRRFVTAQDVADMVAFFASAAARNVSGQVVGVDGHTESLANPFDT